MWGEWLPGWKGSVVGETRGRMCSGVERRKVLQFGGGGEKLLFSLGVEVRVELLLGGCVGGGAWV